MCDIYQFIIDRRFRHCLELGTGFGATACVMAAALQQVGGRMVTVDRVLYDEVNVKILLEHTGFNNVDVVIDDLGYNWYLADLVRQRTIRGFCKPLFDFCLLDGAHEWEPDALAFELVAKLLKPGGWIAIDDLNFNLRMLPYWSDVYSHYTDRALDAFQMQMVYDLVVRQDPRFHQFQITHENRMGWARKRRWYWI